MENTLIYEDILVFDKTSMKCENDVINKKRENIIYAILNNLILFIWYTTSDKWKNLKNELLSTIKILSGLKTIYKIKCKKMGARKNNFDFIIHIYINAKLYMTEKIEFKFNAKSVPDAPQILTLSGTFNLLRSKLYAEDYYDTYNQELTQVYGLPHISRVEYLNDVHKVPYENYANVHEWFNLLKQQENNKIKKAIKKKLMDKSIDDYLNTNIHKIDIDQLNEKLYLSQKNKKYILYCSKTKKFYNDTITDEELTIVSTHLNIKKNNLCNNIICDTLNPNTKINVLLRWKNTNGILMPAWQISIKRSNK